MAQNCEIKSVKIYEFQLSLSLSLSLLVFPPFLFAEESITITTYYPSPYGSYRQLTADQIAIGSTYRNPTYADGTLYVSGNVGIGTTTPGAALDVSGTAKMTGFQLGTSTTSGYVLTANSSGVGTWQAAAGGGATCVGATTSTYTGSGVGGYSGGDAKCNAQYAGSRMCAAADFAVTRPTVPGWYNTFTYKSSTSPADCTKWTSEDPSTEGAWWATSYGYFRACSLSVNILCCK